MLSEWGTWIYRGSNIRDCQFAHADTSMKLYKKSNRLFLSSPVHMHDGLMCIPFRLSVRLQFNKKTTKRKLCRYFS